MIVKAYLTIEAYLVPSLVKKMASNYWTVTIIEVKRKKKLSKGN